MAKTDFENINNTPNSGSVFTAMYGLSTEKNIKAEKKSNKIKSTTEQEKQSKPETIKDTNKAYTNTHCRVVTLMLEEDVLDWMDSYAYEHRDTIHLNKRYKEIINPILRKAMEEDLKNK